MLILTLDAALPGCSAGVVRDGTVLAERLSDAPRGQPGALPAMAQAVLSEAGVGAGDLSAIAVTVGPGSFTGLRAALSLAQGIAVAAGVPILGVTVGEALHDPADPGLQWTAIDTRRGRVFLDCNGAVQSAVLDTLPEPSGIVTVAGDAAQEVAARLCARGFDVVLRDARLPTPAGIAAAALRREAAGLPPRPAQPLYVDPPEARPPA